MNNLLEGLRKLCYDHELRTGQEAYALNHKGYYVLSYVGSHVNHCSVKQFPLTPQGVVQILKNHELLSVLHTKGYELPLSLWEYCCFCSVPHEFLFSEQKDERQLAKSLIRLSGRSSNI